MKQRIPLGAQLGVLMGTALTLMVILLGVILYEFQSTSNNYQLLLSGTVARTIALQSAQDDFHEGLSNLRGYMAYSDEKYAVETIKLLKQSQEAVKTFTATTTVAESKQAGEKLQEAMLSYTDDIKRAIALKQSQDAGYTAILSETRHKTETVNQLFNDLMTAQNNRLNQRVSQFNERQAAVFKLVIGSSSLGILSIIALLVWYSRQLASRINNLSSDLLALSQMDLAGDDFPPAAMIKSATWPRLSLR